MKALVIGAARSGLAITRLLLKHHAEVTLLDLKGVENQIDLEAQGVRVYVGPHPQALLKEKFDVIIKNPGIPHTDPYVGAFEQQGYFIYNEVEIALNFASKFRVAAITGTNGKTTTTELLGHLLAQKQGVNSACGNNGYPFSEFTLNYASESLDVALEIAAFQLLGCQSFKPKFATILNLSPDHLDVFESVEAYYESKTRIFQKQDETDTFFLNLDDPHVKAYAHRIKARIVGFSLHQKADLYVDNHQIYMDGDVLFDQANLKLKGKHNLINAMVAAGMALRMGVTRAQIQQGLATFSGVEHRIEYVTTLKGVEVYNDSKATTAESTVMAIESFNQPLVLLVGGYDKQTGFEPLKPYLEKCKAVIAFGQTKAAFKSLYPNTRLVDTMQAAIDEGLRLATRGDVLLLSPACASYDQFKNFEDRGNQFKQRILSLRKD